MNDLADSAWYAVHTQPNAEMKAAANLARKGFEAYLEIKVLGIQTEAKSKSVAWGEMESA